MNVPQNVKNIWNQLETQGHDVFLVGGAVRDFVMGVEPNDFDLATSATPNQILDIFPDANFVGASFGVVIVNDIEVATFRNDIQHGVGNHNVSVKFTDTINDDLSRRDFTCNAIAMDSNGCITDPFGGINDINNKIIRFVGDGIKRIEEDPNRILRLFRFSCRFGFEIHPESANAVTIQSHLFETIAPERIQKEVMKVMSSCDLPSQFFLNMMLFGFLDCIFPELADCWLVDGGQHHNETVWVHNMTAGDSISKRHPLLRLAMFLHDVGKPQAWVETIKHTGKEGFFGHEKIGVDIVEKRLHDLKFSNDDITFVKGIVATHMRMVDGDMTNKAKRRLFKSLHDNKVSWKDLVLCRIADTEGNLRQPNLSRERIKEMSLLFHNGITENTVFDVKSLEVSGKDVMDILEINPGPEIGEVLNNLFELVMDTGRNEREFLLERLRGMSL